MRPDQYRLVRPGRGTSLPRYDDLRRADWRGRVLPALLGLAPFLVLLGATHAVSVDAGLWGAAICGLVCHFLLKLAGSRPRLLQRGTLLMFGALAIFSALTQWRWTVPGLRVTMTTGLLAIILASLAAGHPFTIEYARERVPRAMWSSVLFMKVNRHITWAWAVAFALLALVSGADLMMQSVPSWVDGAATLGVTAVAILFTGWYPGWVRRNEGGSPTANLRSPQRDLG